VFSGGPPTKGVLMLATETAHSFVGRQAELTALQAELAMVRAGHPRLVLVEGPAGIGKSAVLDRFLAGPTNLRVLRAAGEQWEAFVAYGVADQLMRVAGVSSARLLAGRQRSLPAEEPVGVGARILDVIEELEQKAPVAIVVDDAHWADVDSLRALLFVVRRLVQERVLTLLAQRSDDASRLPEGLRRLASGRTGTTLRVPALSSGEVNQLATKLGVAQLPSRTAQRLRTHTDGNPLYITTLLTELPSERWRTWEPALPAPQAFADQVVRRLKACSEPTRRLVEATAVMGGHAELAAVAVLAEVGDPVAALGEAVDVNLLRIPDDTGVRRVAFFHPLVKTAVYELLGPAARIRLHAAAVRLVEDEHARLRHRVAAAIGPDTALVEDLDDFARRESSVGAWSGAAWALVEASQLSSNRKQREHRLLLAVDAVISAGDLYQAEAMARDVEAIVRGPLRDATMGYLAVLRGRAGAAANLLHAAWDQCDPGQQADIASVFAQRLALHEVGQLRGPEVVTWARRAVELSAPDDPVRVEAEALLGLGLGWQGRMSEGLAAYESVLARLAASSDGPPAERVQMAHSWLRLVADDVEGARSALATAALAALQSGSVRIAVWSYMWLARAGFMAGAWDAAAADAERAVSLLDESGHEWLRPLARLTAALVPAARGEWTAADEHARMGRASPGDYRLMVVAAGLAQAHLATARDDHEGVLQALAPVVQMADRAGVDEPGFWPWQDLYGDALVSSGRLAEAEIFLGPHEELAARRGRGSMVARLARVRGRLAAARGDMAEADAAFRRGLGELTRLPMPFQRALLELAFGEALRRSGRRRAAAERLKAAHATLRTLRARPYLERCERELAACGLAAGRHQRFDASQLTAQELAVARLVAQGMSNRQVASELFVSVKTVQFHLTRIYAKLGVSSRTELAAQFRDTDYLPDPVGGAKSGEMPGNQQDDD
jgi:ATP/maltotriose-dependent transcriptional regulator MalT